MELDAKYDIVPYASFDIRFLRYRSVDLKLVDTSIVVTQDTLVANTRYYWHVSAVNAGGEGAFSGASTFLTSTLLDVALAYE